MNHERLTQVLLGPHVSEKTTMSSEQSNTVVFKVLPGSTKPEIKAAVEKLFNVKVESVRMSNHKGKIKRVGQRGLGKRSNWRKASVRLHPDSSIEMFSAE